jgi:hypothetical protein
VKHRCERAFACVLGAFGILLTSTRAIAQEPAPHDHAHMNMGTQSGWQVMEDAIVFADFNHQGSDRGGTELVAPNWWMGMAMRNTSRGQITFTGMLSLDPATVGKDGYREIFQAGEALNGRPIVDRQHPHDLFMQLAAVWHIPLNPSTGLTLAGAPVGEPALGPVAFMHRPSAGDNPTAPLGHHTFDSTHVAFGVITAAIDHGPWTAEGSVFNAREPDEDRWDFDFARLDSVSARVWYRFGSGWEAQVSTGHLTSPEQLETGNVERSTASIAWTRTSGNDVAGFSVGLGRNDTDHGARGAVFVEGATQRGATMVYSRFETLQVETALLDSGVLADGPAADVTDPLLAFTVGGVRNLLTRLGVQAGLGADVTFYGVPDALQSAYGSHPVSFHIFLRLRPVGSTISRMWNMRMSQPMAEAHVH